jgi:hypothetical protein
MNRSTIGLLLLQLRKGKRIVKKREWTTHNTNKNMELEKDLRLGLVKIEFIFLINLIIYEYP